MKFKKKKKKKKKKFGVPCINRTPDFEIFAVYTPLYTVNPSDELLKVGTRVDEKFSLSRYFYGSFMRGLEIEWSFWLKKRKWCIIQKNISNEMHILI